MVIHMFESVNNLYKVALRCWFSCVHPAFIAVFLRNISVN